MGQISWNLYIVKDESCIYKKQIIQNDPTLRPHTCKVSWSVVDEFMNCFQWYLLRGFNNTRLQSGQIIVSMSAHNIQMIPQRVVQWIAVEAPKWHSLVAMKLCTFSISPCCISFALWAGGV